MENTIDKARAYRLKSRLWNPTGGAGTTDKLMAAFADEISAAAISKREREIADELEAHVSAKRENTNTQCLDCERIIEKLRSKSIGVKSDAGSEK